MAEVTAESAGRWIAGVFDAAARQPTAAERSVGVAGQTLAFRFGDEELAAHFTRSFAHLPAPVSAPELTVIVGSNDRSTSPMAEPPWGWRPRRDAGRVDRYHLRSDSLDAHSAGDGCFSLVDWSTGRAIWWHDTSADMEGFQRSQPARLIMHWWASRRGGVLLHTAAVGTTKGAALLVGAGGSGKSTTALACLGTGLRYLSDDYALVMADAEPIVHSLYCSGTLDPRSQALLPHLEQYVEIPPRPPLDKSVMFAPEHSDWCVASLPVAAVVSPMVAETETTRVTPMTPLEAMVAAAPSTLVQLPGGAQQRLSAIRELVGKVPSFRMELGRDVGSIPARLEEIIDGCNR